MKSLALRLCTLEAHVPLRTSAGRELKIEMLFLLINGIIVMKETIMIWVIR